MPASSKESIDKTARFITSKFLRLHHYYHANLSIHTSYATRLVADLYLGIPDKPEYNYFTESVEELLSKYNSNPAANFEDLVINIHPNHRTMQMLAQDVSRVYFGGKAKLIIGGQVKLHPPNCHDENSIQWHYDGDPLYQKIIIFLQSGEEGHFYYIPPANAFSQLLYSPLTCITKDELLELGLLRSQSITPLADIYSLQSSSNDKVKVPIVRGQSVLFHGSSILHKGGNNKHSLRPVFQGLVSIT